MLFLFYVVNLEEKKKKKRVIYHPVLILLIPNQLYNVDGDYAV